MASNAQAAQTTSSSLSLWFQQHRRAVLITAGVVALSAAGTLYYTQSNSQHARRAREQARDAANKAADKAKKERKQKKAKQPGEGKPDAKSADDDDGQSCDSCRLCGGLRLPALGLEDD